MADGTRFASGLLGRLPCGRLRRSGLAAAALALAASGCGRTPGGDGVAPGAPIVWISIDTLRSDRLPLYGYARGATPAIDALAAKGVVFEHAYSHVPLTLPSHSTMLTGLLPGDHGVRDNLGYRLRPEIATAQGRLRAAGYATGAAVSAFVLRGETGLAKDFDLYEAAIDLRADTTLGGSQRSCEATLDAALPWLRSVAGKPFFFFYHLYEPHTPYEPPADLARGGVDPYDAEISAADRCVGRLVGELERSGVFADAAVFLVSDHGEGLGDHGEPEHGILLYREALQIPMILKLPGGARAGTREATAAGLFDLLPTSAAIAGLAAEPGLPGRSLLARGGESRAIYSETYYPRLHMGWSELHSVIEVPYHWIDGPQPELYDFAADPGERSDLVERERRLGSRLRDLGRGFVRPLAAPAAEDEETARQLAALGYLGGAAVAGDGPLPDPKSKIHVLDAYGRAVGLITHQRWSEAAIAFEALARENPQMVDAWENYGLALHRLGRLDAALAALETAMRLSGGVSHVALATGQLLLDLERLDEAKRHAELALADSPAAARNLLAQVALARKDLVGAEREARAALAARGSRIGPLIGLAQVLREQGRYDEALASLAEAETELARQGSDRKFPGLHFVRGDVLARLDRPADAEVAFLAEIRDYPSDAKAYTRLAALYTAVGAGDRAVTILRLLVERNAAAPAAWAEAVKTLRVLGDPEGAARLLAHARQRFPTEPLLAALD